MSALLHTPVHPAKIEPAKGIAPKREQQFLSTKLVRTARPTVDSPDL
jgi:hypothetical protein